MNTSILNPEAPMTLVGVCAPRSTQLDCLVFFYESGCPTTLRAVLAREVYKVVS